MVEQFRCPPETGGCEFKLRPDVHAFGTIESSSVMVHNQRLPTLASPNAARVELRLSGVDLNSLQRAQLRVQLKKWLTLPEEPTVVEAHSNAHAGDTAVVVDLPGPNADQAAQLLANLASRVAEPMAVAGYRLEGSVLKRLSPGSQVQQQDVGSGSWHPLAVREPAPEPLDAWGPRATMTALLALSLACVRCVMLGRAKWQRWRQLRGAVPLAMSEEDAEEEEREGSSSGKVGPRGPGARTTLVDLDVLIADDDFPA